jgi:hypothetical protein
VIFLILRGLAITLSVLLLGFAAFLLVVDLRDFGDDLPADTPADAFVHRFVHLVLMAALVLAVLGVA